MGESKIKDEDRLDETGKKEQLKTELQTKSEFESTQKKRITTKKPSSVASTEKITLHDPSHIKGDEERYNSMKEQVDKHKREIEELEKKLSTHTLKQTKFEMHVEKKLKELL